MLTQLLTLLFVAMSLAAKDSRPDCALWLACAVGVLAYFD